jgi:DNA-binding Lrp family transcriptional regulator
MDTVDQQILELLARNARMTNRSIAQVVGTSDRTVARRIEKLETRGVIQQYTLKLGDSFFRSTASPDTHHVNTSISEWESIRAALTRFFGSGAAIILFQIGYGISQSLGIKIQAIGLTPSSQLLAFTQMLEDRGWGSLDIRHLNFTARSGTVAIVNSPFKGQRRRTGCDEMKGMITGFLETLFTTQMLVTEVKCVRKGHAYCEFVFKGGLST